YYRQISVANQPDAIGKMKQFACWFTHGVGNGSELRRIVHAARKPGEVLESVERFFEGRADADMTARVTGEQGMAGPGPNGAGRIEDPAHGPTEHDRCEATLGT